MNKMAIFVEGYSEVVFVDRLIEEIAGRNMVLIEWRKISGGTNYLFEYFGFVVSNPYHN